LSQSEHHNHSTRSNDWRGEERDRKARSEGILPIVVDDSLHGLQAVDHQLIDVKEQSADESRLVRKAKSKN
jgi:hypothetical protein